MKQRFNKLLAVMLSASLALPMIPGGEATAASGNNVTFTEPESVSVSELGSERSTLFNEGWKFFLGNADGAQAKDYSDASWTSVDLPHDFSISQDFTTSGEAESGFLPGGTGWYRKKFSLPEKSCNGKSIVLNFDGVYKDAYVYVNGQLLGEHHYGYTPFAFDISDYVTCDGMTENVIAVRVEHTLPSSRWYSGSGIYRDVNLIITNPVHVALNGTEVTTPDIADGKGTVKVDVDVSNEQSSPASVTVRNTVYTSDGKAASAPGDTTKNLQAGETATVSGTVTVTDPKLWSIDEPNMYYVHTEILVNGTVVDSYDSDFGFRWFAFDDTTGFSLNGKNVKLNGVCMHHDQGALGSAAYYDAIYRQLSIMKEMGANAIRITHNPQSEQYLKVCNELGLLAIEEFFDGWDISKNGNSNDFAKYFSQTIKANNALICADSSMTWAEFTLKSTVRRDRNNPSLILWSLGNEIQEGSGTHDEYITIAGNLIRWMKEEDSFHQATSGDNTRGGNSTLASVINTIIESGGAAGYNYGDGANGTPSYDSMYQSLGHGFIASETSSATNSRGIYMGTGQNADGKLHMTSYDTSAVGWGKTAHNSIWNIMTHDYISGEFVWTGFDYIGEPTPWNGTGTGSVSKQGAVPNSSFFGIVETSGFPKDSYYLYRSQWKQDATTLHLVTAWDSDNQILTNGKTPVWIYSNAPVVKLYRDDTLVGTATREVHTTNAGHKYYTYTTKSNDESLCTTTSGTNSESLYSIFNVAYANGTISAKAFEDDGTTEIPASKISGTTSVSTPETVSKIVASTDKTELTADGRSLAYITLDITDGKGTLDTTATNEISLSLTGNGKILGVDNGDQSTVDKYQQQSVLFSDTSAKIKAFAGKALVIVSSTTENGSFTLSASADGLTDASVKINTVSNTSENQKKVASYHISKNFYAPAGTSASSVMLPATVDVIYTDGSTEKCAVTWKTYDKAQLKKAGSFNINGSFIASGQTIDLFVTAHIYNAIISANNYAGITKPGVIPTLPSTVMTYYAGGIAFQPFPVSWDLKGIKESDLTAGKTIEIPGTVSAFGYNLNVTASIRVVEPDVTGRENVATAASKRENVTGVVSDTFESINDGNWICTQDDTGSRWTNWNEMNDETPMEFILAWDTVFLTDQIDMYYFISTGNDKAQSQLPTNITIEYSLDYTGGDSGSWNTVQYDDPVNIEATSENKNVDGYSYKLKQTINPIAIRITLGHDVGKFIGLTEVEVMRPTEVYNSNSSSKLSGITAGGAEIRFNDSQTEYEITAESFADIKFTNEQNASVTLVPESYNKAKLIVVSEDGSSTTTYTLTLKNPPAVAKDLSDELNKAKDIDSSAYPAEGYAKLKEVIDKIEQSMGTASKETLQNYLTELKQAMKNLQALGGSSTKPSVNPPSPKPNLKNNDTVSLKSIQYKVLDAAKKTVTVVKGENKNVKKVVIPATVTVNNEVCSVVQISPSAFKNYKKLTSVTIGANVTTIGKNAFNGCKKLKKVTFKGTAVKQINGGAFKKTSKKMTVNVPKKLKKKQRAAFKKKLTKAGMSKKLKLK